MATASTSFLDTSAVGVPPPIAIFMSPALSAQYTLVASTAMAPSACATASVIAGPPPMGTVMMFPSVQYTRVASTAMPAPSGDVRWPDARTIGWSQPHFEHCRICPSGGATPGPSLPSVPLTQ